MAAITIEVPSEIVVKILDAYMRSGEPVTPPRASSTTAAPAQTSQADPADPWDTAWPTTPSGAQNAPGDESGPPGANPGGSGPSGSITDSKGRLWTFGTPNAPQCQCGEPAVLVKGKTGSREWTQWRCAKDYDDYKHKCAFSEFVGK